MLQHKDIKVGSGKWNYWLMRGIIVEHKKQKSK